MSTVIIFQPPQSLGVVSVATAGLLFLGIAMEVAEVTMDIPAVLEVYVP